MIYMCHERLVVAKLNLDRKVVMKPTLVTTFDLVYFRYGKNGWETQRTSNLVLISTGYI